MWRRLLFMLMLTFSASCIKVPVDNEEKATELLAQEGTQTTPVFYISDHANVDSYLIPPDPHQIDASLLDAQGTPATYLIPPSNEKQTNFYVPTNPTAQSDWLPILQETPPNMRNARFQKPPQEPIPIFLNLNHPSHGQAELVPVPLTHLVPPSIDAVNEFILPSHEIDTEEKDQPDESYNAQNEEDVVQHILDPAEPTLALHLIPPREENSDNPTKLYPKKYAGSFKPVPIPIAQFADEKLPENSKAKPVKYFKLQPRPEIIRDAPVDEKNLYHYQKAEHQRKLKEQEKGIKHESDGAAEETYGGPTSAEQETSETNLRYPGRNPYPAPLRQAPSAAPLTQSKPAAAPDGRTEFRMHGMKGPHSYQFGYDTGKGKNRQFRFEERDNEGIVHGHYGYMDRHGKLRVVNYSAHPEYGFRAEEPKEKE